MATWKWNERLKRYQKYPSGKIISWAEVQDLVDGVVDRASETVVDTLVDMLADGRMNVADWKREFASVIKSAYIIHGELAAGGRENMTPAYWGSIGGRLARQYGYLDDFAEQIDAGQLTEGQIRARAYMYINSSRQAFWGIRDRIEKDKGMTEERWIAIGDDRTCGPCSDADASGWQPIGTFAAPGSGTVHVSPTTTCAGLTNCRCQKEYR